MPLSKKKVFGEIEHLVSAGVSCHWLKPKSKAPVSKGWQNNPFADLDLLDDLHSTGNNIGFRPGEPSLTALGYLHVMDLDIRDETKAEEAHAQLRRMIPNYETFPTVMSGSGGASRHYFFFTDKPFGTKKLAKSDTFTMVWDEQKGRDVKKNDWEIDLLGSKKNCVLPPSIHPDTGLPYVWLIPLEPALLDPETTCLIASDTLQDWGGEVSGSESSDDNDLMAVVRAEPLDLDSEQIAQILADLPEDWPDDRDRWLTVGSALHHESKGEDWGLRFWNNWSMQSGKYDAKDQTRVWKSFGERKNPVRMPTLMQAASANRLEREMFGDDDDTDTFGETTLDLTKDDYADLDLTDDLADLDLTGEDEDDDAFLDRVDNEDTATKLANNHSPDNRDWISHLAFNEDGTVKNTLANVMTIMQNDVRLRGVFAFNDFRKQVVITQTPGQFERLRRGTKPIHQLDNHLFTAPPGIDGIPVSDAHKPYIRTIFEGQAGRGGWAFRPTLKDVDSAISMCAHDNTFHPVRNFFREVAEEWDGVKRIDTLLIDYLKCDDTPYYREVSRLFVLGPVARIMSPGCKHDYIPVIEGAQGIGKSTFVATLAMDWFVEISVDDFHDAKTAVEKLFGKMIAEIGELGGLNKADSRTVKAFTTRRSDRVRLAYRTEPEEFPRQSVMVGTTNDKEYLKDPTGNRRFLPIEAHIETFIDIDRLTRELRQIWAEAYLTFQGLVKETGQVDLSLRSPEARRMALQLQETRRIERSDEGLRGTIEAWLDEPTDEFAAMDGEGSTYRTHVCLMAIWVECLGRSRSDYNNMLAQNLSQAMSMLDGWERTPYYVTFKSFGRQRAYVRKISDPMFEYVSEQVATQMLEEAAKLGGEIKFPSRAPLLDLLD